MKKKIWIPVIAGIILLAVLFVPIPMGSYDDGGTREWNALSYKIVKWNRLTVYESTESTLYEKTRFYFGADRFKSIDALWERESAGFGNRGETYTDEWMEKSDRTKTDSELIGHIRITEIYNNCFFASPVIPMPYQIKLNGTLSSEWCVGDQVLVTYENIYYDDQTHHIEADFLTVEQSDFELDPNADYKPVIYLYPEEETELSVKLDYSGHLTCTYPKYNDGWTVTASPDGTLTDEKGQIYNYLYWEGETLTQYDLSKGFCVTGEDTAAFFEDALAKLGLNRREANEFIVFWLPMMQENPYNIISFQGDVYTESAKLEITPAPDTVIRVFMAWQASDEYVEMEAQELSAPERDGFTVIEWGGTEVK